MLEKTKIDWVVMNIYYRKRQKAKGEGSTKKVSKNWLFSFDGSPYDYVKLLYQFYY